MNATDSVEDTRSRRFRALIYALLLALIFACVYLAAILGTSAARENLPGISMLSALEADYKSGAGVFAPLDQGIIDQTAADTLGLSRPASGAGVSVAIAALPPIFRPTEPVPVQSPTPQLPPSPTAAAPPPATGAPTAVPTEAPATATAAPPATATPGISPTPAPTGTPGASPTPVPTSTSAPPTPTSPPPTPTSPPPTPPPPTSPPPEATPTSPLPPRPPTATPTPLSPVIVGVNPNQGYNDATIPITISGANFVAVPTVTLDATPLAVGAVTASTINATIPAWFWAGIYTLTVTNPDGRSATLPNAFTVTNPIPVISAVIPDNGPGNANTDVTINGSGFVDPVSASMDGFAVATTFVDSTTLNATVPSASMPGGVYTLTIANPGPLNPTGSRPDAFTVTMAADCSGPVANCSEATGAPDGNVAEINEGGYLTITFPAGEGIKDGPGADFVYFEWPNGPGILMDWVIVEISDDAATWHTVLNWGDNITDTNTNLADFTAGGEQDNELIPSTDLYWGGPPLTVNTGITIDIHTPTFDPTPGTEYRFIRFSCPSGGGDPAQVDAVLRLH
jgi:hypothetical protein